MSPDRLQTLNPPVGISHVTHSIEDLYRHKLYGRSELYFHPAAQLNSHPHLGTVTTLCATFALAKKLEKTCSVQPRILFWALENAPGDLLETGRGTYYRTLEMSDQQGRPRSEFYMESFHFLLERLAMLSGFQYEVMTYRSFQSERRVRELIIEMIRREEELAPLLCPSERRFKVRFACPECGWAQKSGGTPVSSKDTGETLTYENHCFEHGAYPGELSPLSSDLFDINTPVRALAREAWFIERTRGRDGHNMMSDGADWAHFASINMEALAILGYEIADMPLRFFSPVILDDDGAKLAKSAQVGSDAYWNIPQHFVNLACLREDFGDSVIDRIWDEVSGWLENPKEVFRSYTIKHVGNMFRSQ